MKELLILGFGYTGAAVARLALANGYRVRGTVRKAEGVSAVRALGAEPLLVPALDASMGELVEPHTHVVVTFPPDGVTDQRIAVSLKEARAITYISSTGVYGELRGRIDDDTPVPAPDARARARLAAESLYRAVGGTVLRCPGIYGPDRGLHVRLARGDYAAPANAQNTVSRIHVHDLARFILAAAAVRAETFVLGDLEPAPHARVVAWLCATYGFPPPPSIPAESVHYTLRADRAVDSQRARRVLGLELEYPTYREGMAPLATGLPRRSDAPQA